MDVSNSTTMVAVVFFRDSYGRWIKGYTKKIGTCDALHAEMW
ncbi:hypothetical protein L195_g048281, partial [Trifolium pratense]